MDLRFKSFLRMNIKKKIKKKKEKIDISTEKVNNFAGTDQCYADVALVKLSLSLFYRPLLRSLKGISYWREDRPNGLTGRASCWSDWKSVLLEWLEERPAGVTGRAYCWSDWKGALLEWLKERPAGVTERASCWSDWKGVLLEWLEECTVGVTGRAS